MNCPACGYYNPEGQQSCFHCSLPLPLAAGDAFCPAHPGVKATGACSRCGTFGCGACLQPRGADWLCPACFARGTVLPWDERASLGLWVAWWRTAVQMLSSPSQALASAEPDAPLGSSMLFAALSTFVGFAPTLLIYALILIPTLIFAGKSELKLTSALVPLFAVLYVVVLMAMQLAMVLVFAGLEHLGLMLMGAQPKAFTVTVRAAALSMGVYITGLMPFCGPYVFWVWSLVLRIIANMHLHKTTAGKATAAVLLPVLVLCGGFFGIYVLVFALAMNTAR